MLLNSRLKVMRFNRLKKLSPVPIHFVNEIYNPNWCGVYYGSHTNQTGKELSIEIIDSLTDSQKTITLVHEIGHALCDSKGCECMKSPDHTQREIHAYKFTLKYLMKHKLKAELKSEIAQIIHQANGNTSYAYYQKTAKHIMKLRLWRKCLDYVEDIR